MNSSVLLSSTLPNLPFRGGVPPTRVETGTGVGPVAPGDEDRDPMSKGYILFVDPMWSERARPETSLVKIKKL